MLETELMSTRLGTGSIPREGVVFLRGGTDGYTVALFLSSRKLLWVFLVQLW